MLKSTLYIMGKDRAGKLCGLIVILFVGALLEMAGISLIGTVCVLLVDADQASENVFIAAVSRWTGIVPGEKLGLSMLVALICFYLFKMLYMLMENYIRARFVRTCQHDLSTELYEGILRSPYVFFTKTSCSSIVSLLEADLWRVSSYMTSLMQVVTEGLVLAAPSTLLLILNPAITAFVLAGVCVAFILSSVMIKRQVYRAGQRRQKANAQRLRWLNQGVYGIKDVKVGQTEDFFSERYRKEDAGVAKAALWGQFLTKVPVQATETILATAVLLYILVLVRTQRDIMPLVPSMSALVMAAIRLLPCCSRINSGLNQMGNMRSSVEAVAGALRRIRWQKHDGASSALRQEVALEKSISAEGVTFRYEGRPEPVLENVHMEIPIGSSVGIVGPSGAGKTTLVDVLLGLLEPQQGMVYADGVEISQCRDSYLEKISYIPQNVFLLNDTIRNNVAFGIPPEAVDDGAVWDALEKAALAELVRKLPEGLDCLVGENGIRISGGERQRLGIARALYQRRKVMVFDEATSALDPETEEAILGSIDSLRGEKTMIIISHRHSAVAGCDRIYRVEGSRVKLSAVTE